MPLDSGSKWQIVYPYGYSDSYVVEGREKITVPAGTFDDAIKIGRKWRFLNDYLDGEYWLVRGIGIVKKWEFSVFGPGRNGEAIYDLVSFNRPKVLHSKGAPRD